MSKKLLASYVSLGAVALALIFVLTGAFAKIDIFTTVNFSYFDLTFGRSFSNFDQTIFLGFSFINLLSLLFMLGGITLLVLNLFAANFKDKRIFVFIAAGLIGIAGIFFALVIIFAVPAQADADFSELRLGSGAIFALIFSLISAGAAVASETVLIDK